MKELLKKLCLINGVSGDENEVREAIIDMIKGHCDYHVDNLGNLICFCKGTLRSDKKLMIRSYGRSRRDRYVHTR